VIAARAAGARQVLVTGLTRDGLKFIRPVPAADRPGRAVSAAIAGMTDAHSIEQGASGTISASTVT